MSQSVAASEKGLHNHFVKKKLHQRIRHLSPANIHELSRARTPGGLAEGAMPGWFEETSSVQRQIVRDSQQHSRTSNETLAKTLKGLKSVTEFAQPLLEQALQKKFALKVDVTQTWLYEPLFSSHLGTDQNLLQLALRNFESDQSFDERTIIAEQGESAPMGAGGDGLYGWYYPKSGPSACYKIRKLAIEPADFAALCRELDIGKQYQDHLTAMFDAADRAATVRTQTIEAWKDNLRVHAHIARLKGLITPTAYLAMLGVLNGEESPKLDGEPVAFSQLHVLGLPASEMFVIGASRRKKKKVDLSWSNPGVNLFEVLAYKDSRIIVCIPGDPVTPVKEYASLKAFEKDLALRLREVNYQRSFLRLIPHGDAGRFLGKIQPALQTLKWNADFPHRKQTLFGQRDGIYESVYRDEPELDLSEAFFDGDLFSELYTRHKTRLKETAWQLAVPTAKVDHDAWYERLAHYAEWGLNILNVAAFFVPGLGEVMMAVMAVQLTLDVYHGVEAWSIGDTDQAWNYLESVAANMAFMAVMGAVVSKAPKMLSTPISDGLVKIKLPFGDEQLWRPGLAPYKSNVVLPSTLKANKLGQYEEGGRTYIRLDGEVYEKTFDPAINKWRLKHPTDPHAYHPVLEHNGHGAWRHSFERPLEWNRATLLRRMGHLTDGIDTAVLEKIADISGVDDAALRKMHVDNLRMPSLLSDTLRQFQLDRQVSEMIEKIRLGQTVPDNRYNFILSQVVKMPRWPQGRVIEVFDQASPGGPLSHYGQASMPPKATIRISSADISAGKLAGQVLSTLEEQEIVRLLGGEGARVDAERETVFRQQLADHLTANKTSVFDSVDKGSAASIAEMPDLKELQRVFPSLSNDAAQEILANATTSERLHIKQKGRLPASLLLKGRVRARLARLNRALAGMHLQTMASLDSQRLALHALEKLPGWPEQLRVEIRQRERRGQLLASIGSESAEDVKYLVVDGYQNRQARQFQAFDREGNDLNSVPATGDNFYASIMHALPDDARLRLGLPHVGQSAELQKALTTYAAGHRELMMEALEPNAVRRRFKTPTRLTDGRMGYPLSGRGAAGMINQALISRVRDVYPDLSDELAEMMVRQLLLEGSTESQIAHLLNMRAREYAVLTAQLDDWAIFPFHEQIAQKIRNAWRSRGLYDTKATVHLDLSAADILPKLNANFPHVRSLELSVSGVLSQTPETFIRQFPNVRSLNLAIWEGAPGAGLVETLQRLTTLRELQLVGGLNPGFSESVQALIDVMPQLERLELRGVASELDVSRLPDLRSLSVSGSTEAWPKGALELPHLSTLDVSHSNIETLPPELFEGHESLWPGLKVNWARFDPEQFVKAYEYVLGNRAHVLDSEQMLDQYCRDTLQNAMNSSNELSGTALKQLKSEGLSGGALLDHVNGVRQDRQALYQLLEAWQARAARVNGRLVDPRGREIAARLIRECWRSGLRKRLGGAQDTPVASVPSQPGPSSRPTSAVRILESSTLDLSGAPLGDLPELPTSAAVYLNHVQALKMPNVLASVDDISLFLRNFTDVRELDLSRNQLFDVPSSLSDLSHLTSLHLQRNCLMITPTIQGRLNSLSSLESLDLRYNRVESLNVASLRDLKTLRLGHTAITTWPKGALDLPKLRQLELNNSAIIDIPKEAMTGHDSLWIDLSGCRLQHQSRSELLASSSSVVPMGFSRADLRDGTMIGGPAYFPPLVGQHPELLLALPVTSVDDMARLTPQARLQRLDPTLESYAAIKAVDELTLSKGGAGALFDQLTKWDAQYQTLTQTLNTWIAAPPHQLTELHTPLWISAMERRKASELILTCWRQNLQGAAAVEGAVGGSILDLSDIPLGSLPPLTGDFAHVGVLKLNKVFLYETGLDGVLGTFGGVHTLELNGNLLNDLPEPVSSLPNLVRLSASDNRLTASTLLQNQLAALTKLESLNLAQNWLETLDITSLIELRTLDLHGNRLVDWPGGALSLPSLRSLDLHDNMIESLPPTLMADEHRLLRDGTNLSSNDNLDVSSLVTLRDDAFDSGRTMGWTVAELEEMLNSAEGGSDWGSDTSSLSDEQVDLGEVTGTEARERWIDPSEDDAAELTRIWNDFEQTPNSEAFFNLLVKMEGTKDFTLWRADLTRRVHGVLKAADLDTELRDTIFGMAASAQTCGDGRILLFSGIEVKVYEFETLRSTPLNQQDSVLFKLGRKLFRLGKLEQIADREVINRRAMGRAPDPAEVRLAYRIGLAERLELPGQPKDMLYSGNVTPKLLDEAYAEVIQAEQTRDFLDDMVSRKYWTKHLKRKYADRFIQLSEDRAQSSAAVEEKYPDYSSEAYLKELGMLEVTLGTKRTQLLIELTELERAQSDL